MTHSEYLKTLIDEGNRLCILSDVLERSIISIESDTLKNMTVELALFASELSGKPEGIKPNGYQRAAMRTAIHASKEDQLMHGVLGLTSEAGEVSGMFQKKYQGHEIDNAHLAEELGDCLWMIAEILDAIDVPMEECMRMNIDKLKKRYPDGFDPERSLNRELE